MKTNKIAGLLVLILGLAVINIAGCSKEADEGKTSGAVKNTEELAAEESIDEILLKEEMVEEVTGINEENLKNGLYIDYNGNWFVLSNDFRDVLDQGCWVYTQSTYDLYEDVESILNLKDDNFTKVKFEIGDILKDNLLGVNSSYYFVTEDKVNWNGLVCNSPCTVDGCIEVFNNYNYTNVDSQEILNMQHIYNPRVYNLVSGTIFSDNILWTVKILLCNDTVECIIFEPEGGIQNTPADDSFNYYHLLILGYTRNNDANDYITGILTERTLIDWDPKLCPEFDFSDDEIKCSEAFNRFTELDLPFKACYIGKSKRTLGYTQSSSSRRISGYSILDKDLTSCELRLGEKAENEHILRVANTGNYYTVNKSKGITEYIINYRTTYDDETQWYYCVTLDNENTVLGISFLSEDIFTLRR